MKSAGESILLRFAPRWLWRRRVAAWPVSSGEVEEALLPWLADPAKTSIDVGCADGAYALHLYLHSRDVVAFEPNPQSYAALVRLFGPTPGLRLLPYGLSSAEGSSKLYMPKDRPNLSSFAHGSQGDEVDGGDSAEVRVISLDSLGLREVGFIKIDVEGHEEATLEGAKETIARETPCLLIEIEERHNPGGLERIVALLEPMGYAAHFLHEDQLHPVSYFRREIHQNPGNLADGKPLGLYINNFLFLPRAKSHLASRTRF